MFITNPYLRLMRIHQPVGTWLLLWPCWWAAALAGADIRIYALLAAGAFLMRSAGCIINDICDREFDTQVERTRMRPLASGEISMFEASALLALLLSLSLLLALTLGMKVVLWSLASIPLVILYPLMKRITWWPQMFLGLTFNWGALVGYVAVTGAVSPSAFLLYIACIFWTLGYDTIYAHQDIKDDAKAGVHSTARLFGEHSKIFVFLFYAIFASIFFSAVRPQEWGLFFFALMAMHLAWQVLFVRLDAPSSCKKTFSTNALMGWLALLCIISSH